MTVDVLFYDDRGGFGPTFNRTNAVGGAEMHLLQVAEFLAGQGMDVMACTMAGNSHEGGVMYRTETYAYKMSVSTLLVVGCAGIHNTVQARKTYAFQVVDPRPHPERFAHQRGRVTQVCVSEWQANLFRELGHDAIVIPVPIPDEWYGMQRSPVPGRFVCVSSWNKGARETIEAWDNSWGELAVGSPYSHPDDAEEICRRKGVTWLGTLRPRERWIEALASGESVARVCTIAETFGVVDVAARAMGMNSFTWCTGDVGSLHEMGVTTYNDSHQWGYDIMHRRPMYAVPPRDVNDFRASRVLPKWLELLNAS